MRPWLRRVPCLASGLWIVAEPPRHNHSNYLPRDCFCFGLFHVPGSLEDIFEKGGKKRRLSQRTETARGSSWWEPEAANGTICHPRLLLLHAILQLALPLPATTPALFPSEGRERGSVTELTLPTPQPLPTESPTSCVLRGPTQMLEPKLFRCGKDPGGVLERVALGLCR